MDGLSVLGKIYRKRCVFFPSTILYGFPADADVPCYQWETSVQCMKTIENYEAYLTGSPCFTDAVGVPLYFNCFHGLPHPLLV